MSRIRHHSLKSLKKIFYFFKRNLTPQTHYHEDGYVQYMSYVCSGDMLEKGNIHVWDYVIKNLESKSPILEIGAFAGLSTNIMTYFLLKHGKDNQLYTVDYWKLKPNDGEFFHKEFLFEEYNNFVKESYIRNVRFFSGDRLPLTYHMDSLSFFEKWNCNAKCEDMFGTNKTLGGKFSFCFIDGDHTYKGVKQDFFNADKVLEDGGFLMFDDSSDGSGWDGINKVMQEVIETKKYDLVMRNPNYLFKKISVV